MEAKSSEKVANSFGCLICDYSTARKSNYDKHMSSLIHQRRTKMNGVEPESSHQKTYACTKSLKLDFSRL